MAKRRAYRGGNDDRQMSFDDYFVVPTPADVRRGEGAGTHAAQGGKPPVSWPVEETEIGLQYVIPGCERRESARPARQSVEGGHG